MLTLRSIKFFRTSYSLKVLSMNLRSQECFPDGFRNMRTNYDFFLRDAIAASISCPDYYEPYHKDNTIFMDMMLAQAKNPAMNAYIMAKHLRKNKKIRMLSISANDRKLFKPETFSDFRNDKYNYKV
jgi:patatin-like phospholipase/acyl hydrolase